MTPESVQRLSSGQRSELLTLVRNASDVDGVAPLSEQVLLEARERGPGSTTSSGGLLGRHFLTFAEGHLAGYAHLGLGSPEEAATAEVVVDPAYRRLGLGGELVRAVEGDLENVRTTPLSRAASPTRTLQLWSHGDLPAARALALNRGYARVRELWQMRRSLQSDVAALPAVTLPQGFRARPFVVGQDEQAWLRVNALAFAHHLEQGRMTRVDLDRREAEPWFDAKGFILVEDLRGPEPVLAASHWTKVVPIDSRDVSPTPPSRTDGPKADAAGRAAKAAGHPRQGEVYVVGVDPAYQGHGLGRTVTVLGLAHLRKQGLTEAMLYVDADNLAAVATYSRLDFARSAADIMYSRTVHPTV